MDLLTPNVEMDLLGPNLEPETNMLDIPIQDFEAPENQHQVDMTSYEQKKNRCLSLGSPLLVEILSLNLLLLKRA